MSAAKNKNKQEDDYDDDSHAATGIRASSSYSFNGFRNYIWGPTCWSVVASLSFLCTGLLRAYTSPALLSIQNEIPSSFSIIKNFSSSFASKQDAISWIASTPPLASFLGTILSGPLLQYWGRQPTLCLLFLISTIGWLLVGNSWSFSMLLLGRSLTGLGSGLSTATAPLYISEVFSSNARKKAKTTSGGGDDRRGLLPGVMLAAGILLGFVLAHQIQAWQRLALIIAIFPGVLSFVCWTIPESPIWLSNQEEKEIQFDLEMEQVVPPIPPTTQRNKAQSSSSTEKTRLISKANFFPVNLPIYLRVGLLMLFQQWSGGNVLIYYLSEILTKTRSTTTPGLLPAEQESTIHQASLIIALFQFIGFFLALPLIDHPRVGRRFLLVLSSVLMMLANLFLGFHFHHINNDTYKQANYFNDPNTSSLSYYDFVIRVGSLAALLSSYSIGLGPIPFLFIENGTGSTCGTQGKRLTSTSSYLSSFASLVNHLALFLAVKAFPYLFHTVHGPQFTFWLLSAVCWITAMFTFCVIPSSSHQSSIS